MKELFPSVSLSQTSESVRANFGHEPFAYAVEDVVKALEETSSQPRWPSFPRLPSFPSEILQFVLDALHLTIDEDDSGDTNEYKRTINSCALTCRYWSRVCCPYLFESITIRSKEDLNTLLDLMARPDSHIPSSILRLEIWEGSDVWAHNVAMSLASKLPKLETVTHERMGDPTWKNAQRRTPPQISRSSAFYSAYQVVTTLVLKNHHFSSFAALTQLVKALPKLDVLKCEYLSWEERPYNPRLLRAASHLSTVQVEYGGRWELIQLFTARWGRLPLDWDPSSKCPELNPSDLSLVHELLKLIVRQKHPPTYEFSLRVCAEIRAWHLIINTIDSMMQDQRMRWCLVFSLHNPGVTGTAVVTYLTELRVSTIKRQNISYRWSSRRPHHNDQVEKDLFGNLLSCSQLDDLFSKFPLPYLRTVTIAVRSEEEVSKPYDHHATSKKIASTLREKLPYLQGSGKLSLMMG
ncbi:hypothetical protein PHLCEN_2v11864 [Hermanssonia centrifuga]|uniref:F-box domain-containing protein n=1 Tax=Hermanssonia centrifuga TaxID=98765 RepID=A0A2R6NJT9_9APHY|nr:hypothetical protein PHLCEN_2v11864 [Hermanssonia centrifuga]